MRHLEQSESLRQKADGGCRGSGERGVMVSWVQGLSCAGPRALETCPRHHPVHLSTAQTFRSYMFCVLMYVTFYVMYVLPQLKEFF